MRGPRWRWWAAAGAALLLIVLLGFKGLAPRWVRGKVQQAAAERGLVVSLRDVRVGLGTLRLEGLTLSPEGVSGVEIGASSASAPWTFRGLGRLTVEQVQVRLAGEPSALREALGAWRARHPSGGQAGGGSGRSVLFAGIAAIWTPPGQAPLGVQIREAELAGGRIVVRDAAAKVSWPGLPFDVEVDGLGFEVDRGASALVGATARHVVLHFGTAPTAADLVEPPPMASAAPAPSPLPSAKLPAKGKAAPPPVKAAPPPPVAPPPPPEPSPLWAKLAKEKARLDELLSRMGHGLELRVDELSFAHPKGRLGPWIARVVLGTDALTLEMQPAEKDGRKPLELRALVPRGPGKWSAELRAGPATLAEVGIAEGNFGLTGVDKASITARGALELDPDLKTVAADGTLQVSHVSIQHAGLSDLPITGIEASLKGVVSSGGDFSTWSLTGGRIELGKGRLELEGTYERVSTADGRRVPRILAGWTVPVSSCGDVLASMPKGLMPRVEGMEMTGTFAAHGRVTFDGRAPDKADVDFALDQHCRIQRAPLTVSVDRFQKPFELRVYDPKGQPKTAMFGPGTGTWTPFSKISPYVIDAVLTCEDGAFFSHAGFSAGAIRNALVANLRAGKFLLGASTVTMQTAKNAFLDRKKQLGRKFEEAVLTAWLEQALSKNQILELYLNVIEFGPDLYGIGPAAMHWFGRSPADLDAAEAMFLVSLLPSPVKRHGMWGAGAPNDGYLAYVRTLLKEAHRRGKLDDEEYEAASKAPITFHRPGDPPPAPHGISAAKVDPGKADDPTWDPVAAPD